MSGRRLRDYQTDAIAHLKSQWAQGLTRVPMVLATGLGKGHPLDTEVPTPDGFRMWGDLAPGDMVYGADGEPTRVDAVYDRGELHTFRVTFTDGASAEVDADHLWMVNDATTRGRMNPWSVCSTADIASVPLKRARGWRFKIPMGEPIYGPEVGLPLDPYTVGALIANGSMTGASGVQLTTPDTAVIAMIRQAGIECTRVNDKTPGTCPRYFLPGLTAVTRTLGLRAYSVDKRIPARYMTAGYGQRLALLNGLMDGDGSARDATRRTVSYSTKSEGLARDVSELVASLGGTGRVKRYDRGGKGIEYAVRVLLPSGVPAFATPAKANKVGTASVRNMQPVRSIERIEYVGIKPIRCIKVAAHDSLYRITRQYIVTHNTEIFTDPTLLDSFLASGQRVLIVAHTDELIEQAAKKARRNNPGRRIGIVKAAQNETTAQIVVSSRQTLASEKRRAAIRNVGLIIIDEAHHALRTNTYGAILEHFGAFADTSCSHPYGTPCEECWNTGRAEPQHVLVAGFTATLARGDKGKLASVWETGPDGIFKRDILFGIRRGYLLDVRGKRVTVPDFDMSRVRQSAGDYRDSDLAEELERTFAPEIIAASYLEHAKDSKGIAFWPLVETAEHGAKVFNAAGIRSETIHGKLGKTERRGMLERLHTGETQVIHGVGVLTEGFDEPTVDVVVIARPTRSAPLYQQMVGRVLRPDLTVPAAERGKALILDVVGAGGKHDLRSLIDLAPERDLEQDWLEEEPLSLLELDEQFEELREDAAGEHVAEDYMGPVEVLEFDPLGRSQLWSQTPDGTWYMGAGGDAYAFLVDSLAGDPGTYDVVLCGKGADSWARGTEHVGLPLDLALAWAEEEAEALGGHGHKTLTGRKSPWRRKQPSSKAVGMARSLGIVVPTEQNTSDINESEDVTEVRYAWNAGRVSEEIDKVKAARRIDPLVRMVKGAGR